jgi:hypothetical protein
MYRFGSSSCYSCFLIVLLALFVQGQGVKQLDGATGVLWEPVDISEQDVFIGPGGHEMEPDLSSITFIRDQEGGASTKYRIRDGSGRVWVAKLGIEARSETAASRLLSAVGYKTEIVYTVPSLTIPGRGTFKNVRLEARPADVKRGERWKWDKNPFVGTRELQGLKIMTVLMNNWDTKSANHIVLESDNGRRHEYVQSDVGATFGRTGIAKWKPLRWFGWSKSNPKAYARSKFITGTKGNRVKMHFNARHHGIINKVTIDDARWVADLLTQLSDKQIRDAFRAGGYSAKEIEVLTKAVRKRIDQLDQVGNARIATAK